MAASTAASPCGTVVGNLWPAKIDGGWHESRLETKRLPPMYATEATASAFASHNLLCRSSGLSSIALLRSASGERSRWKSPIVDLPCGAGSRVPRRTFSGRAMNNDDVRVPELQVPRAWMSPAVAEQEAEWLRGALHQWLDDEFIPEPANEEISRRCARVYRYCLLEEQLDIGDILMQMVRDLETFSFKESFHGAFSSANAAIELITRRMRARDASAG